MLRACRSARRRFPCYHCYRARHANLPPAQVVLPPYHRPTSPPLPGQMHSYNGPTDMAGSCDGAAADSSFFKLLSAIALE